MLAIPELNYILYLLMWKILNNSYVKFHVLLLFLFNLGQDHFIFDLWCSSNLESIINIGMQKCEMKLGNKIFNGDVKNRIFVKYVVVSLTFNPYPANVENRVSS
jgi:hypothetical protein